MQERMNAGHASTSSSLRQPGNAVQATGCNRPLPSGGGCTHGDDVVGSPGAAGTLASGGAEVIDSGAAEVELTGGGVDDCGTLASGTVVPGDVSREGEAGVGCVVVAHDAISRLIARTAALRQNLAVGLNRLVGFIKGYPMFWIFLELALGLALFVLLVWWTLPKKDKDDRPES